MDQHNSQTRRLFIGLAVGAVFGLGVGLLVGLAFGYIIAPLEWTDAGPQDLREDYAAYYWEMVADSYGKHGNLEVARRQLGDWTDVKRLEAALNRARIESSPELKMVLDSLEKKVAGSSSTKLITPVPGQTPTATVQAEPKGAGGSLLPILGVLLLVVLAFVVLALLVVRSRKAKQSTPSQPVAEETPEWLATMSSDTAVPSLPPLGHFVTSYSLGNDNYDESFSIETSTGDFLGECGVGISETIGVGDPDKVTAFEIWLFDKNDIRTVTKVMMSEHAYSDPELRASLASKGEAVLVQVNKPIVLETATLRVDATVTEGSYGAGALPPNSFFDRLTVELVAHQKEPTTAAVGTEEDQLAL